MSADADEAGFALPAAVAAALDARLAAWGSQHRVTDQQLAAIRGAVLAPDAAWVADAAPEFDVEWLWELLRPVTDLVERSADLAEFTFPKRFEQWLDRSGGDRRYQPYLQLA